MLALLLATSVLGLHLLKKRRQGKGVCRDRSRMFLLGTPALCSGELLLLESVRGEKVQSVSEERKGSVGMVLTGVRTQKGKGTLGVVVTPAGREIQRVFLIFYLSFELYK